MYVLSFIGPAISYMFIGISSTAICLVAARVVAGQYVFCSVWLVAYLNPGLGSSEICL